MIRIVIYRVALGVLALTVVLLCIFLTAFNPKLPLVCKIANGYKGWAIVRYEDPSCAPFQRENIFLVISIPSSGTGCTSSALRPGWRIEFFEYVSGAKVIKKLPQCPWRGNGEIWAAFGIPYKHSESFFVGTEQELQRSWASRPK